MLPRPGWGGGTNLARRSGAARHFSRKSPLSFWTVPHADAVK